jgi:hypothetical protein
LTASPSANFSCGPFDIPDRGNTADDAPQGGDESVSGSTGTASPYLLQNGSIGKSIEDYEKKKIGKGVKRIVYENDQGGSLFR